MIIRKRATIFIVITFLFLLGLIYRLAEIQLIRTESFSASKVNLIEESVRQRTQVMVLDQGRGRFVDRNGKALTHDYFPSLILFPFLKHTQWPVEELASILQVPSSEIIKSIKDIKEPIVYGAPDPVALSETQMEQINKLKIPGVFAVHRQSKVEDLVAEHLIGIIRQDRDQVLKRYADKVEEGNLSVHTPIGILGLQQVFDEFLLPEGESKLMYHVDNQGGPLFGIDVKYTAPANPYYPISIQTTIDKSIQEEVEKITTDTKLKKGGVVLLDIKTNEIVAMVSSPSLNHSNPFSSEGGAHNYLLEPQIPGSVFKTIVAAAAIENNIITPNRLFNCDLDIYGQIDDHKLGQLNFEDSFAQSCNQTFASLANELVKHKPSTIEDFANKLGLIQPVGWNGDVFHFDDFNQLPVNRSGRIWEDDTDKSAERAVSQTAIGQKEVRVTPLAVANMMGTIARGGEKKQVKAVSKILYKNGSTLFTFKDQALEGEALSPYTIAKLQQLLHRVVTDPKGTGRRFQALDTEVAGKSGTAETGRENIQKEKLYNKWFAGYFPATSPKYALVVVELDVPGNQAVTNDVFYKIVDSLE
ncbi:peptidoglycan D,D-transpeptidase FtsI family protein [Bacillus suaedaesalsae]|uniref:serine-type D-Ala-D-Ala carboxypeptidase n=1 Tax=Bacillus suaedaesalsae TaxID=2810349 RepID=A0ABS2DPN8_9BACI|nr:penicillin-binding protein 2 [Bacillus suaedaesalsae]MBM6619678.1 penicillin-binding protein 2 [Bacillus suaedaesalsae]